jgi:hypothetical protein
MTMSSRQALITRPIRARDHLLRWSGGARRLLPDCEANFMRRDFEFHGNREFSGGKG